MISSAFSKMAQEYARVHCKLIARHLATFVRGVASATYGF